MKRFYKFLMPLVAVVAMALPWKASAQLTTIVADGTTTNSYVPLYGLWMDDYTRSQCIYPATMLEDLNPGDEITSLTYFSSDASFTYGSAAMDVKLGEVTQTTMSSYLTYTATTVYSGAVTVSGNQMVITFTTPYIYQGGNLMVEFYQTATGTYHTTTFYGVTANGASASGYNSSSAASVTFNQRNFLPKMEIEYIPGTGDHCFPVRNLSVSEITDEGATLSWMDTLNFGASYTIISLPDSTVVASGVSDTSYVLTGLNPNTPYQFGVYVDCSTLISGVRNIEFRTACGGYTEAPYTEDFEGLSTGDMPNCWQQVSTGTSGSGIFPSVYNYTSNTRTGDGYFEFESSNGGQTEIAALPAMQNISGLKLIFWASMSNSYPCTLEAGVIENDSIFVPVQTIALTTFSGTSSWKQNYHEYTVYFSHYTGSGERMALRASNTGGQYTLFIDDLMVVEDNGCYPVMGVTASDIDSSSVTLQWVDTMNMGITYTVSYWTAGGDTTVVENISDTTYTATNLNANTNYNFIITPNCASGDGIPVSASFRTACVTTAIPYVEDFESYQTTLPPPCWEQLNGNPRVNTSVPHSGSKHLYFSGAQPNTIVLPPMNQPTGTLQVRFWTRPENYTSSNCGSFSVGYMTDINVDSTFVELANWLYSSFSAYEEKEVPMVGAPDDARIVLRHNSGSTNYYWYVDDLVVEPIPACNRPVSVTASNVTSDGADIAILGTSDAYRVYYTTGSTTDSIDIYDSVYTFTTLDASTNYTIAVAAICDDGSITGTVSTSFRTLCGAGGCMVTIDMTDSYGDGWNNAAIYGYANGDQVFSATISSGSTGSFTYSHCATDTLVLRWHTGSYDSETGFSVALGGIPVITGSGSNYSNNGFIYQTIGCPSCNAPNNITVGGITGTDAIVSWNANGGSNFRVYLNGGTTADSVDVTGDSTYTFTTLDPSTTYTLIVATICDDGSTAVANPVTFTTACAEGGCEVLISMVDSYGDGWNGNAINGYINGNSASVFSATLSEGSAGSFSYSLCAIDTLLLTWVTGSYSDEADFVVTVGGSILGSGNGDDYSTGDTVAFTIGCPSCSSPSNFMATNITTDSATISWTPAGSATEWLVTVNGTTTATTTTSMVLSGLSASTAYTVEIRTICDVDDTSMALIGSFRTACGAISLPFSEDFESIALNTAPPCWDIVTGEPYVNNYTSHSGNKHLYFTGSYAYEAIALPATVLPTGTLQVRLWTRPEGNTDASCGTFSVGYMTNLNVDSTYVELANWSYSDWATNDYEEKEVPMVGAPDSARIVLRHNGNNGYYYWFVDDVEIELMPDCPRPGILNATSVFHDQIDVEFHGSTSGDYIVYITDGASYNDSASVTADSTYSFTGLTPLTTYTISVVADCGASVSPSREITVATTMVADTLPLNTGFEVGQDTSWMILNGTQTNQWVIGDAVSNDGSRALYISNDNGVSNSYSNTSTSNVYAMKLLSFDSIGDYTISYDWRCQGESGYYDWLRVFLAPATVEFTAGSAMPLGSSTYNASTASVPAGWIDLNGHSTSPYTLSQSSSWNTVNATFSLANTGNYYLVFMWSNDGSGGSNPPAAVDNVQATRLTCPTPQGLTLDASDMTSLSFSWTPAGSESAWEVTVGTTTAIVTTNSYTASGLTSSSSYNVSVRAICGAGDTSFAVSSTFATSCGVVNIFPHSEGFESAEAPANCWTLVYGDGSGSNNPMTHSTSEAHSGIRSFRFSSFSSGSDYNQYLISPELSGSNLVLSFWHKNYDTYADKIQVGYSSTTSDTSAFTWGAWIQPGTSWAELVDTMPAGTKYVAIHYYGDYLYYTYIDDLTITGNGGGCPAPTALTATATETTVTMNWSGSAASYEVACVAGNWTEPTNPATVTGNTTTFTGLTPNTQYSVGVRAVCDTAEGLYSEWVVNTVTTADLPCLVPTNVTVPAASVTVNSAVVSWTADAGQSQFELRYSTGGDTSYVIVNNNPATLTGLLHATTYSVSVRAICAATVYSDWSAAATFTTEGCDPVSNVRMGTITATTATVMWNGSASAYEVAYGLQGVATDNCTRVPATGTSHTITGLEPDTYYDVYVRAVCDEGVNSDWSAVTHFTTQEGTGNYYTLTLNVNDPTMGTVSGAGTYLEGTSVTARATSNAGYHFVKWSDNVTDSVRTIVMTSDITLTATFAANVGIEDVNAAAIALYPNPASSTVTVIGIEGAATVTVVDMNGREVSSFDVQNSKVEFDVSGYAQGAYFVRITGEKLNAIRKLIVR